MSRKIEIIAEIGINHGGDVEVAREMIQAAAEAGADTVKFQCYNPLTEYSGFQRAITHEIERLILFNFCCDIWMR